MTAYPLVSVIVVSRARPILLRRCLLGLSQLYYPNFEVIVVADPAGVEVARSWPNVAVSLFDQANISAARNIGISQAAGEILAFIDDDAVPEPTWLDQLTAPFANTEVSVTGGYVRGRNGIEFQWRARTVGPTGFAQEVLHQTDEPFSPAILPGEAVKTEGTNFAVRRDILASLGGFDPVFRFFLDETDLNMRLAKAGAETALVPLAQVHHGFAASAMRRNDRAPTDLFEIGASSAVFLRKHAPLKDHAPAQSAFRTEQHKRLLRHVVEGGLEPRDVGRILASLDAGFEAGRNRDIAPLSPISKPTRTFAPFSTSSPSGSTVLAGRPWNKKRLRREAMENVAQGKVTSVFRFSPTALPHWRRFTMEGYWEQRGGLFGRSDRTERPFKWQSFAQSLHKEWASVAKVRTNEANEENEP
ncbi:MAG: glycosyltransferase family 2 protein [Maritimibacter sp.]